MTSECTLVLGLDKKHLKQLSLVWPTWIKHKPELVEMPKCFFYDIGQITPDDIAQVVKQKATCVPWPPADCVYPEGLGDKWTEHQRVKMLSGFVHVPAEYVETEWWLKLDTDTIATGEADWIPSEEEFQSACIIAQKWGFTKPANQMVRLDQWVQEARPWALAGTSPLALRPKPGAGRLSHPRIISWCGFFHRGLTKQASEAAVLSRGPGKLPVPSQDGYLWYFATRQGKRIIRKNFKALGWKHRSTMKSIKEAVAEVL